MAQWDKLTSFLQNDENSELFGQLVSFYDSHGISITLREDFAAWIEKVDWSSSEVATSPDDILQRLIDEVRKYLTGKHVPFVKKQEYQKAIKSLQKMYGQDPSKFVDVMKRCLKGENDLLTSKSLNYEENERFLLSPDVSMRQKIKSVSDRAMEVDRGINSIDMFRQSIYSNSKKEQVYQRELAAMIQNPAADERKQKIKDQIAQLTNNVEKEMAEMVAEYIKILNKEKNMIQDITDVTKEMIEEHLNRWKVFQKYPPLREVNSNIKTIPLDKFENLFGEIFEITVLIKQQLQRYYQEIEKAIKCQLSVWKSENEKGALSSKIQEYINSANQVLQKLFDSCVVLEEQPPQVIKVDNKQGRTREMRVVLRCLLSSPYLSFGEVNTEFRNEQELSPTLGASTNKATKATVKGGIGKFSKLPNMPHSVVFEHLRVENFRRTGNDDVVTEQKYGLRFSVDIILNQMQVPIRVVSLPMIVCCHTSQECSAQASIFWYNAFSTMDSKPYEVDKIVPWFQFKQILDLELQSKVAIEGRPGRGFAEENYDCIAEMLGIEPGDDGASVSWEKFNRDFLPPKNKFSFWKWFLATIKLIKDHFCNVWNDNLVAGYLTKKQIEERLKNCCPGTFDMRFSSSHIETQCFPSAALSVVLCVAKPEGGNELIHCQPFTSKKHFSHFGEDHFGTMLRNFVVNDTYSLTHLYPDKPISEAFAKYCPEEPEQDDDDDQQGYNPIDVSFCVHMKKNQRNALLRANRFNSMSEASASPASQRAMDYDLSSPDPRSPQSVTGDTMRPPVYPAVPAPQSNPAEEVTRLLQQMNSTNHQSLMSNQLMGVNQNTNNSAQFHQMMSEEQLVPDPVREVTIDSGFSPNMSTLNMEDLFSTLQQT